MIVNEVMATKQENIQYTFAESLAQGGAYV
jgi:hypothetical protein